jgi:TRAP transporter TAXI family solute receptor
MKTHYLRGSVLMTALALGASGALAQEIPTVDSNLDIHIPFANYQPAGQEEKSLWADLEHIGKDANGDLLWKLDDYGFNAKPGKICTSPSAGTYYQYAGGIIEAAKDTLALELENVPSVGSLANAKGIATGRCDMGFVQGDIFVQTGDAPDLKQFTANKGSVAALYQEQVHILVNKSSGINTIADLAGKKVNLGTENSGTYFTANKLLTYYHQLSSSPIYSYKRLDVAVDEVVSGELDATFFVADAPISLLADLPSDANVTLIPATIPVYTTEYTIGEIPASAYPWLDSDVKNNIMVWSLLVIGSSVDRSKLGAFLDKIYANKNAYATKYHAKWSMLDKDNSISVFKTTPTSGWGTEAVHYYAGTTAPTAEPQPFFCSAVDLEAILGPGNQTSYTKAVLDLIPVIKSTLGLSLTELHTNGSIDNLNKLYNGECAMAIIQDDVGGYAAAIDAATPGISEAMQQVQHVRAVMPLFAEQGQLIVNENSGINSSLDMAGKKFNMGLKTSGTYMTASTMLLINGLSEADVTPTYESPTDAISKVISGEYDAMFITSKAPVGFLTEVAADAPIEVVQVKGPEIFVKKDFPASHYAWQDHDVPDSAEIIATVFISPKLHLEPNQVANFIKAAYQIQVGGSTVGTTWNETTVEQGANHFKLATYLYDWNAGQFFTDQMFLNDL